MAKLRINSKFFQKWTSDMAYILGFVAADGCVTICHSKDRKNPRYYFCITNKDFLHLQKIKKALSAQHKIHSKRSGYTGKKDNYQLQIENKQICDDLINLGIIPRKTSSMSLPKIPSKYFSNFVRGFFDGDGSVYVYTVNGTPQIKSSFVCASYKFIKKLNEKLCKSLNISLKTIHKNDHERKATRYTVHFYIDDTEKLGKFMYKNNPTLYLFRKYNIFRKWDSIKRRKYKKKKYPSKVGWKLNKSFFEKKRALSSVV